jgi:hypothetical protein
MHMRTSRCKGIVAGLVASALVGMAAGTLRAQVIGWPLQNFTGSTCGWESLTANVTFSYDPTQDDTGNGGGSGRFTLDYGGTNSNILDVSVNNVDCCYCDLEALLNTSNYVSLDFDVKWDGTSGVPLSYFNSDGGGVQIYLGNGYSGIPIASFTIPDAATNGWVHVSAPFFTNEGSNSFSGISLFKNYTGNGDGTATFWLDNVSLVGRTTNHFTVSPVSTAGGVFTLKWNSVPNYTYSVQRTTDTVTWTNLVTAYPPGGATGTTTSYTDSNSPSGHALYRVSSP